MERLGLKQIILPGLLVAALLIPSTIRSQVQVFTLEKPIESQSLSGLVQLGDAPEGVPGVLVEKCSADWKTVEASTKTNKEGRFTFPKASKKGTHYLRFSFSGARTLKVKVRITSSGPKDFTIVLQFAT